MSGLIEYFTHHMLICDDELYDEKRKTKKSEFNFTSEKVFKLSLIILN